MSINQEKPLKPKPTFCTYHKTRDMYSDTRASPVSRLFRAVQRILGPKPNCLSAIAPGRPWKDDDGAEKPLSIWLPLDVIPKDWTDALVFFKTVFGQNSLPTSVQISDCVIQPQCWKSILKRSGGCTLEITFPEPKTIPAPALENALMFFNVVPALWCEGFEFPPIALNVTRETLLSTVREDLTAEIKNIAVTSGLLFKSQKTVFFGDGCLSPQLVYMCPERKVEVVLAGREKIWPWVGTEIDVKLSSYVLVDVDTDED